MSDIQTFLRVQDVGMPRRSRDHCEWSNLSRSHLAQIGKMARS
jgi:hypothetical protein